MLMSRLGLGWVSGQITGAIIEHPLKLPGHVPAGESIHSANLC